ncbi:MAG: endonuclease/exonuclease/phosphatase family protein [Acidobacteria bacterium]|nr:endonuclease/exonuclease/phosphatase family protein [Acidobacteriota bacterium]MBI3424739.1 endonuclease/exonuclease/phosphatase family protein [Acidobacteriota bacterium]
MLRFRVVTYNIHKCQGLDRRVSPERIVNVLREIDADVIALQEVLAIRGRGSAHDQAHFIAESLGMQYQLGENRRLHGGAYGNLVLTRWPMNAAVNHDISIAGREQRGCLRVDIQLPNDQLLHVYNVHLGTSFTERRQQARRLLDTAILHSDDHNGPRIMLGDFNEWTRGMASRLLAEHFQSADMRLALGRQRTYPGVLPFLHLDHIYYDKALELEAAQLHRGRLALVASDHLPIVAEFHLRQ